VEIVSRQRRSDALEDPGLYTDDEYICPSDDEEDDAPDPFTQLVCKGVSKCVQRGRRFLRSGRILRVWDAAKSTFYFIKAQVQASMEQQVYVVTVTIREVSGQIADTTCDCKARALKRCAHIAGVLILVVDHVEAHGYDGKYCTLNFPSVLTIGK